MINHPFSRGSVHITLPNVAITLVWDPNYSANPLDLELPVCAVRFAGRVIEP